MASLFQDLLSFFGITPDVPQNLGEFFPWFFSILVALGLTLALLRAFKYIGAFLVRPRL